ncbi:NADPH-dependent 7-cyano-7-deazaguanine reductase QueF [Pandoraea sp. PE-S2T-3]|uniref:NADPH-dependent 7-cyano-7-deazaguanine reductase QueF n=1 Tax=Pandoraea sp. PE-S2T-3 TaxID=1986993 RepID=UPI000B406952|nr:NADPH-dependent 7-cyano-7-deazaguanine reductase QueF [Pandoraea sp. PE-S2T-3]
MSRNDSGAASAVNVHATHGGEHVSPDAPATVFPRPLPRARLRGAPDAAARGIGMRGYDLWNDYEVAWLDMHERPQIAVLEIVIPCDSPFTLEMSDARRYLSTLRELRFESAQALEAHVAGALTHCLKSYVLVRATPVRQAVRATCGGEPDAVSLDTEPVGVVRGGVQASLLRIVHDAGGAGIAGNGGNAGNADPGLATLFHERLSSDLLSSRCPLTGGIDLGTLWIDYTGARICRQTLLAYVLSFRDSEMFHEQCVETVFIDLLAQCAPTRLTVGARFTRRHGLDINPVRSTHAISIRNVRTVRQ